MSDPKRQMHLGVFVSALATIRPAGANEGAFTTSCSFPVLQTTPAPPSAASSTCSSFRTPW